MAKSPVPGRVKTRLCPPCTPVEAAAIATAALADTLEAALSAQAERYLLALDGEPGPWIPDGFEVFPQVSGSFDHRLAAAWQRSGGPGVQIGMDTPQVSGRDLDGALAALEGGADAVLGTADDGGWWLIGLRRPDPGVFLGVPMSTTETGAAQHRRLLELGLQTVDVGNQRDVDTFHDAMAVAQTVPGSRFAEAVRAVALAGQLR